MKCFHFVSYTTKVIIVSIPGQHLSVYPSLLCLYLPHCFSSQAEAEKQDEELEEEQEKAAKQLAEFLEPKAEYYDEDQVETEI